MERLQPENPKPVKPPANPRFSSGPAAKRPGWTPDGALGDALVGRGHRSAAGQARIRHCLQLMRGLLGLPDDYRIAITPGSDTGAMEMAMWSLLGADEIGVDVFAFDVFGQRWLTDARRLGLDDLRVFESAYGDLPDLGQYDPARDCVLTWNATAAGVMIPGDAWPGDGDTRGAGLVIVDATSAVFAVDLPWPKLDVVTFSWQKALGGEAAHGVIVLSPRAVARLENFTPPRPMPKLFSLTDERGKLIESIFDGATINTPSMLCVEDAIDALEWVRSIGGLAACTARVQKNFSVIENWLAGHAAFAFLATDPATISCVSMCLRLTDDGLAGDAAKARRFIADMAALLEAEGAAFDIRGHIAAPPGLRIWGGPTIEADDLTTLTGWIDWAYGETLRAR